MRGHDGSDRSIDPQTQELVDELNAHPVAFEDEDEESQQRAFAELIAKLQPDPAPAFDGTVRDDVVEVEGRAIPVRRYRPHDVTDAQSVVVYLHGGGWVLGNLDSHDRFVRALASGARIRVVSVDYRLATKEPFPAALDDAYAVVRAEREAGAAWIGVGGDSAGGNLAAAVALTSTRRDEPVDAQLLLYPALDATCSQPSMDRLADGYLLTATAMRYYWDTYAAGEDRANELLSPTAATSLEGLPPAVVVTAGFDPLFDDGADYAARLVRAGVPTTYLPFHRLVHGFVDHTDRVEAARRARDAVVAAFAELHRSRLAGR